MKLYYAYESSKVTNSVQEDFPKIEDWKLIHPNWILQDEISRENEVLKVVDGIVVLKTDEDFRQERISNSEQSKSILLDACTKYQQGDAKPRIDSNFFSLLMVSQALKKLNTSLSCPCCDANITWNNSLWADYDQRKIDIDNGDIPNYDFSNNGTPPHTWDQCCLELQ